MKQKIKNIKTIGIIGFAVSLIAAALFGYISIEAEKVLLKLDEGKLDEMVLE